MSIGGYFELELLCGEEYHSNAIGLNTGRNAFEYILRAKSYKKVYLPFFTCDVMLEPIKKLQLNFEFYHIDKTFRPLIDITQIQQNEVLVYNNYFGICDTQVIEASSKYKNLIIDNSQAFFSKPIDSIDTFYSPRKFFGVPDGAYLYTEIFLDYDLEQDISFNRCSHLLGRIDSGAEPHFQIYKDNNYSLYKQPVKKMSNLTQRILSSIDYMSVADIRRQNFSYLHSKLNKMNMLKFEVANSDVPMIYPYLTDNGNELKRKLINNKIYIATYWQNVLDWMDENCFEVDLVKKMIPIPLDQRYNIQDMEMIINIIENK